MLVTKFRPLSTKPKSLSKTLKIVFEKTISLCKLEILIGLLFFFKVFEGFKRVFLVLLTKESSYLSTLKQELFDKI